MQPDTWDSNYIRKSREEKKDYVSLFKVTKQQRFPLYITRKRAFFRIAFIKIIPTLYKPGNREGIKRNVDEYAFEIPKYVRFSMSSVQMHGVL